MAEWPRLFLTAIGALAMVFTAYATTRLWGSQRRRDAVLLPTITVRTRVRKSPDYPHEISFKVDEEHSMVWRVDAVSTRHFFRSLLATSAGAVLTASGDTEGYRPGKWVRRITFEPATDRDIVLVRRDCPSDVDIVFTMSLRASPKQKSRLKTRISFTD